MCWALHRPGIIIFESNSVHCTKVLWDLLYTSIELRPLDETIIQVPWVYTHIYVIVKCYYVKHPGVHVTVWLIMET